MKLVQIRRRARILNGGTPTSDVANWNGEVKWATPVDLSQVDGRQISKTERTLTMEGAAAGSTIAPKGSVLLSTRAPIGYSAIAMGVIAFNQGCKAIVPEPGLNGRFLQFSLMAAIPTLKASGSGSTFLELSTDALARHHIPDMCEAGQRRVADFLDDRVARIDRIIAARRQQVSLAVSQASATLDRTVRAPTTVLRPLQTLTDPMRPIQYGIVLPGPDFPGGVPIIKGGDIGSGRLASLTLNHTDPAIEASYRRSRVYPGDYVIAIRGSVGELDRVPEELPMANLTQDSARIAPSGCNADWLLATLSSPSVQSAITERMTGSTVKGINIEALRKVPVPVPIEVEQARIAKEASALRVETRHQVNSLNRSIQLFTEYKSALITAAVTGELDVTTSGSGIPG